MNFSSKKIWLIGASTGIGAELAKALAQEGAELAISARNKEKLEALASTLSGNKHLLLPLDVTNISSVESAWNSLQKSWGEVDVVMYNAGAYEPMGAGEFNLVEVEKMIDVNLHGALRMLSFVLPNFIQKNTGHIVLVASVAGYRGLPDAMGYGASKAALIHLAENLKVDLIRTNIKVQVINPGFVATDLTAKNDFKMPFIISAEKAATYIMKGLKSNHFEIHFPKRFSLILKFFSLLPNCMYFPLIAAKEKPKRIT